MPPQVNITTDIHTISNVFTHAFSTTPLLAYVLRKPDSTWPVSSIPLDILAPTIINGTIYKQKMGAELVEAGSFAAAAIWYVSLKTVGYSFIIDHGGGRIRTD